MSYRDFGYSPFFEKRLLQRNTTGGVSALDYDALLEDESVISVKIGERSVTASKLALAVIVTELLADGSVTNAKIESISADKITAGTLLVQVDVGESGAGFTRIDGEENKITINDGAHDRILIGKQSGGF